MKPAFTVRQTSWQADERGIRQVRQRVFVEEQSVPDELEWDERDADCVQLLAEDERGEPVGTARLLLEGKIGRLAVSRPWRGRGVGQALLERLLAIAAQRGIHHLSLDAQIRAISFYEPFGFRAVGPIFDDAGIPHRKMIRDRVQ